MRAVDNGAHALHDPVLGPTSKEEEEARELSPEGPLAGRVGPSSSGRGENPFSDKGGERRKRPSDGIAGLARAPSQRKSTRTHP